MSLKQRRACDDCYRPPKRRLALLDPQGDYQCYSDGYVKCFWGLCDLQKSTDDFVAKSENQVITQQPRPQYLQPSKELMQMNTPYQHAARHLG